MKDLLTGAHQSARVSGAAVPTSDGDASMLEGSFVSPRSCLDLELGVNSADALLIEYQDVGFPHAGSLFQWSSNTDLPNSSDINCSVGCRATTTAINRNEDPHVLDFELRKGQWQGRGSQGGRAIVFTFSLSYVLRFDHPPSSWNVLCKLHAL